MQATFEIGQEFRGAFGESLHAAIVEIADPAAEASGDSLALDEVATTLTGGSIRITTRQTIQFHGVGKLKLQALVRALNERLITSYGACGDVVDSRYRIDAIDAQHVAMTYLPLEQSLQIQIGSRQ